MITLKQDTADSKGLTVKDVLYTYIYEFMGPVDLQDQDKVLDMVITAINEVQSDESFDAKEEPIDMIHSLKCGSDTLFDTLVKIANTYYAGEDPMFLEMWATELTKDISALLVVLEEEAGTPAKKGG
jgi:hypothetical protein